MHVVEFRNPLILKNATIRPRSSEQLDDILWRHIYNLLVRNTGQMWFTCKNTRTDHRIVTPDLPHIIQKIMTCVSDLHISGLHLIIVSSRLSTMSEIISRKQNSLSDRRPVLLANTHTTSGVNIQYLLIQLCLPINEWPFETSIFSECRVLG